MPSDIEVTVSPFDVTCKHNPPCHSIFAHCHALIKDKKQMAEAMREARIKAAWAALPKAADDQLLYGEPPEGGSGD